MHNCVPLVNGKILHEDIRRSSNNSLFFSATRAIHLQFLQQCLRSLPPFCLYLMGDVFISTACHECRRLQVLCQAVSRLPCGAERTYCWCMMGRRTMHRLTHAIRYCTAVYITQYTFIVFINNISLPSKVFVLCRDTGVVDPYFYLVCFINTNNKCNIQV